MLESSREMMLDAEERTRCIGPSSKYLPKPTTDQAPPSQGTRTSALCNSKGVVHPLGKAEVKVCVIPIWCGTVSENRFLSIKKLVLFE